MRHHLLYTSQSVQKSEDRLAAIQSGSNSEQEAIRVLKAEWAYLNNPARLERLAQEFLALEPMSPDDILSEPAYLPDQPVAPQLHREVSQTQGAQPQKKPAPPRRAQKNKSFNALLDELGDKE